MNRSMRSVQQLRSALLLGCLAALPAPLAAEAIFQDGFEECGAGRWSAGDPSPIAEKLGGLTAAELANAMGACAPSLTAAAFRLSDGSAPDQTALGQMSDSQSAILDAFGTGGMLPTAGGAMAALSSGTAREPGQNGWVAPELGSTFHGPNAGPSEYLSAHGGAFQSFPACPSISLDLYDSINLRLTFNVPPSATRLAFDWRLVVSDFPEWLCSPFTDFFLAIVTTGHSESLPADRNAAIDSLGRAPSVDSPDMVICDGCGGGSDALTGTGYGTTDAAATEWHTAFVPVVGSETLVIDFMVFDVADGTFDSLVLLDGLRWLAD